MKKLIPLFALFLSPLAMAKIADCPTIKDNGVTYQSHSNYVEAFTGVTEADESKIDINKVDDYIKEMRNRKILWHTELLKNDKVENPFLESDVQWNITCVNAVTKDTVIASDNRNRRFELDKKTGKLLKAYDYNVTFNSSIDNEFDGISGRYGDYYVKQRLNEFKLTGDYAMLIKRIDYINDSMMMVFANKKTPAISYDVTLSLPNDKTYILNNVVKEKIGQLFSDFANNKPIDTTNWQVIDTETMETWYDKNYQKQRDIEFDNNEKMTLKNNR